MTERERDIREYKIRLRRSLRASRNKRVSAMAEDWKKIEAIYDLQSAEWDGLYTISPLSAALRVMKCEAT